jgi:hypothetical protein
MKRAASQASLPKAGGASTENTSMIHIDLDSMHALENHYEQHLGPPHRIYHETVSEIVHIDTYMFPASETRSYMTLATVGMSALPMTLPEEVDDHFRRVELLLYLDYDWDFGSEVGSAPVNVLRKVARYPHEFKTWLGPGHTIGQAGPVQPIIEASLLTDVYLRLPILEDPTFAHLDLPGGEPCHFLWVVPLVTIQVTSGRRTA